MLYGDNNKRLPSPDSIVSKISFRRSNKLFDTSTWSSGLAGAMMSRRRTGISLAIALEPPVVAAEVPRNTHQSVECAPIGCERTHSVDRNDATLLLEEDPEWLQERN